MHVICIFRLFLYFVLNVMFVCFNQSTTGSMLQRAKKQCGAVFTDKVCLRVYVISLPPLGHI